MKVAPLIHTRTLYNDFIPGFLARPDFLTSEEIEWARKLIRASTTDIDLMKGERYLVIDNGVIRIIGIVTLTSNLAKKTEKTFDERYFYDKQGRNIFAFLGFGYRKNKDNAKLEISYNDYIMLFEKFVIPVFEHKVVETNIISEVIDLEEGNICKKPDGLGLKINECTVFESNVENDIKWFEYFQGCNLKEFSFCTNITKYQTVKENFFQFITTTPNNITRLKRDLSDLTVEKQANEEKEYLKFKECYYDRLFKEFKPEIRKCLLKDDDFIKDYLNNPKVTDAIIKKVYFGELEETIHFKLYTLNQMFHSAMGQGKNQRPISIVRKENND